MEAAISSFGLEKFRAKQIFKWIYTKSCRDFSQMSDLSAKTQEALASNLQIGSLETVTHQISQDGTQKFLFKTKSEDNIESVFMPMDSGSNTACISSQIGCAVKCPFCATGTLGFKRNLTANEIIEQVLYMQNTTGERIDNIVFMGQGEPLNNYDNVVEAIDKLRNLVGIGARHITVSTSGVVPAMLKLADEKIQITLALSLHDPEDSDRDYLVPINSRWKTRDVIDALQNFVEKTNRRVTIEYAMLKDLNDSTEKAQILGDLVKDLHCNINLIPYNATDVNDPFQRSVNKQIQAFKSVLEKASRGKTVTVRKERGHDIDAACGQLANK